MNIENAKKTLSQHFKVTADEMHFEEWNITPYKEGFIFTTKKRSNAMYLVKNDTVAMCSPFEEIEETYAKLP